jgi:vacuolar-type H+-ATPase subunit D/Vma8
MNDIANKKTKRILEDLLSNMETECALMKGELQRTEKLVGDIESVLRGMEDD